MKKKNLFLGVLLASTAFSLAACGNNTPATTSNTGDVITNTGDTTNTGETTPAVEKVTVTFNTNGGSAVSSVEINKGEKVTKPATDPTKTATADEKYTFGGWYKDAGCSEAFDFNATINSNTTVYAKWNVEGKVSVAFNTAGGSTVDVQYVFAGEKITAPATNPTKAATAQYTYTFGGWYKDAEYTEEFDFTAPITAETVVYAKWDATVNEYTVTFNTHGASRVQPVTVEYGTKLEQPTMAEPSADDGKIIIFAGWYKDAEYTEEYYLGNPVTGDLELHAKWIQIGETEYAASTKFIACAQDLIDFRKDPAGSGTYVLLDDVDLGGIELEGTANVFSGKFDGNGHTIKNALYSKNASNKTGILTRELSDGAIITNVKFSNCFAELTGETIGIVTGMLTGAVEFSKIEFSNCSAKCNNYAGLLVGRTNSKDANVSISEITCKNGTGTTVTSYGGTLIGDIAAGNSATDRANVTIENCDLDLELKGSNANGGLLSGRIRNNTNLTIRNVVIRSAVLPETTGLICGGGDNNAGNSTVTVENLYIASTNAVLLQSCATEKATNPVTTFSITYTNAYMNSENLANVTDKKTYFTGIDTSTVNIDWLDNTLALDFTDTGAWQTEEQDNTKYRLRASSTNVKSPDAVIKSLKLTTANAQTRFEAGTEFNANALAVTGIYSDGVNLPLKATDEFTIDSSAYNKDVAGIYDIVVKSVENPEVTATYKVEVVVMESFEVDSTYAKLAYLPGEELDISKLLVYATWSDGQRLLTKGYTTNKDSLDLSTAGAKDLVVSIDGFDSVTVRISVVDTKPVVVDNYAYINVDASAAVAYAGEKVNGVETFNTINEALEYLVSANLGKDVNKVIYVANGVYTEKLTVPASLTNLKIIGESKENTRIEYDAVEDTIDPISGSRFVMNCATLHVQAEGFGLENITVNNTFDYINNNTKYGNPQGFALTIEADGAVINDVILYGNQDTLFFKKGRVYLKDTLIMGNIDFIFGENDGIAFFDNCTIKAITKSTTPQTNNGYVTAMKGDGTKYPVYGYVFNNCTFTDDGNLNPGSMSLGRPWGAGASVTMINCSFTAAYSTAAYDGSTKSRWFDMSGNSPLNAHFAEYGSTGDGAITTAVAGGAVLTETEAENYTAANTFAAKNGGVSWDAAFDYEAAYNALVAAKTKTVATGISILEAGNAIAGDSYTVFFEDSVAVDIVPTEWNAEDKVVNIDIADPTIVSYENGKLNGLKIGETTVTLTCGSVTRTVTIKVEQAVQYDVVFVTTGSAVETQHIFRNKKATMPTTTKEGAVFKGWFKDAAYTEEFDFNTPITAETTIYARFVDWADIYKENAVLYFNGEAGDGVDTFTYDNTNQTPGMYYGITIDGKVAYRSANSDTQFNAGKSISFAVEKYATVTLTQKSAFGVKVYFNDAEVTPTIDGVNVIYETTEAGTIKITNTETGNKYLTCLSVTYPEVISKSTNVVFGNDSNLADTFIDTTNLAVRHNGNNDQLTGTMVFYVNAGATINISSYSGYTNYTITVDGVTSENQTGTSYSVTSALGGKVVITSTNNNNYFYSMSIAYPKVLDTDTTITFGTAGNYKTVDGLLYTAVSRDNGDDNCQLGNTGGEVSFTVKAGATVAISSYSGYTAYTLTADGVTSEEQTGTSYSYVVQNDGKVVIKSTNSNNYLYSITITY